MRRSHCSVCQHTLFVFACVAIVFGCSDEPLSDSDLAASAAAESSNSSEDCADEPTRLVCDQSAAASLPLTAAVRVQRAHQPPPEPQLGVFPPGDYQLVAESVTAEPAFGDSSPSISDTVRRTLRVRCTRADERYEIVEARERGTRCFRLKNEQTNASSPVAIAYALQDDHLFAISTLRYHDEKRGTVLGTYQRIQEYAPAMQVAANAEAGRGEEPLQPTAAGRDPRCPDDAPGDKAACSPDAGPLECEYADDSQHRCTRFAQCALEQAGHYSFRRDRDDHDDCTRTNPSACPASFEQAEQLAVALQRAEDAAAAEPMPACRYEAGVCGCARQGPTGCIWRCRSSTLPDCPWPRPLAGDGCTTSRACRYDDGCSPELSLAPDMECRNGVWLQTSVTPASCPLQVSKRP